MKIQEGEYVLCTVQKIIGTTVFVKIEENGEGTIITSEIAPGRIRNLRDYVVPGKKIVCKVLSSEGRHIHLSLRRVSAKYRKEVMEKHEKERSSFAILKSITGKAEEITKKVKEEEQSLTDFFEKAKQDPNLLKPYLNGAETEKILAILNEKKEKEVLVKIEFKLSSDLPNGLVLIKEILLPYKNNMTYLAAGKYLLKMKAESYKIANHKVDEILDDVEKKAKERHIKFERKE